MFFDSDGDPTRVIIHWTHTSTDTNSVTGLALQSMAISRKPFDLVTVAHTYTGNQEVMNRLATG